MRISDWSSDVCSSDLFEKIACQHFRSFFVASVKARLARDMFRSIDAQYLGFQENPFVLDPRQRCDGGMTTGAKTQQESTLRPHAIAGIGIVNDGEQVADRRIFRQRLYPHRSLRRGRQHDLERHVMTGVSITQPDETSCR